MKKKLRQSKLKNYFDCPRKYVLSLDIDIQQTKPMAMGNVFESLVFNKQKDIIEWDNVNSLVSANTKTALEIYADKVKGIFKKGEPFYSLEYETDKYILTGEADYVGDIEYFDNKYKGIIDLKFTGDIKRIWGLQSQYETFGIDYYNDRNNKSDYLQAFAYPFIISRTTGELINFYYLLVQSDTIENMNNNEPLTRLLNVSPTPEDLDWFESFIETVINDEFYTPNYNHCLNCQFFKTGDCDAGRRKFGEIQIVKLVELE